MTYCRILALSLLVLSTGCRTTIDTETPRAEIFATRADARLQVRHGGEPRALCRVGPEIHVGDPRRGEWQRASFGQLGASPAVAFEGSDVLVMTGDVIVTGSRAEPQVEQLSRLWRVNANQQHELLFETDEVVLGSFVPRSLGHYLAIRYDATQDEGLRYGTALLRSSDGALASLPLVGFENAQTMLLDPSDQSPVVLGQRPAGDSSEWGLFRLEGVARRPVLFEAQVVAPAFSADGASMAYAWRSDREAARAGDNLDDGPFGRVSWVDRETGSARHLDTELDVVATAFDPRAADRLYVLGREGEAHLGEWRLLVIERGRDRLQELDRLEFPPYEDEPSWRSRIPGAE